MKKRHAILGGLAAGLITASVLLSPVKHIGPDYLYPNAAFTPGKADTLSFKDLTSLYDGKTYSQAHRNVSSQQKKQVIGEYGSINGVIEIDHFYPLCAGGSNDITNLWPQPAKNDWNGKDFGFHAKDKLEAFVCAQIKVGKIDPKDAYKRITGDWVKYYLDLGLDKTFGGVIFDEDDQ